MSAESPPDGKQQLELPAYHPSAPLDEFFDISTTVDPSYIISSIRKLLPLKNGHHCLGSEAHRCQIEEPKTEKGENTSVSQFGNGEVKWASNKNEAMDTAENFSEVNGPGGVMDEGPHYQKKHHDDSDTEATWEEYGCTLWDLAANETHAELMVQNLILEVLLANLMLSESTRIKEISLGIIGNLACHEVSQKQIASNYGLIVTIVDQLFLDDAQCLCEAFRLMTLCFHGGDGVAWLEALKSEHILSRILWISENTLNTQLIEKSVGFISEIIGSHPEISNVLLPLLMKLGLPSLLINLFAFEMSKLTEKTTERYSVLEIILQAIEALSVVDDFSPHICSNKELFKLLSDLIKLPDKNEVARSCVTAAVLIANMLIDSADLASDILQDRCFLQGLFNTFPLASDDIEARSALWSIVARLLIYIEKSEMSALILHQYVSVFVSNSDLIEDDLLSPHSDDSNGEFQSLTTYDANLSARTTALKGILDILCQWKLLKPHDKETASLEEDFVNEGNVDKLSDCCSKFIK